MGPSDGTDAAGFHAAIKQAQDDDAKNGFLARLKEGDNNSKKDANTSGKVNINACSRPRPLHTNPLRRATPDDPYCVGGKPYLNAEDVPGNQPEALTDSKGNSVLGSDGKPVFGPADGVDNLDNMANKMDSNWTPIGRYQDLQKFKRGAPWDYQRIHDDDGSIIFTRKYTEFANIAIGYADAKGHMPSTEFAANQLAKSSKFGKEPMSKDYPSTPQRIIDDIRIGRALRTIRPPKP